MEKINLGYGRKLTTIFRNFQALKTAVREEKKRRTAAEVNEKILKSPTEEAVLPKFKEIERVTLPNGFYVDAPEKWIALVDKAVDKLCSYPSQMEAVEHLTTGMPVNEAARKLQCGKMEVIAFQNRLLMHMAAMAAKRGLVNVD